MAIQLQEFAKQVLFGTTIEEKLSFPREEIIDTRPGDPIATPTVLTRPDHLKLRIDGVRADHPSIAKLSDERERGRLLHFFGNHELLATELMALAILKFPDAPKSFRMGLLETLKDEQIHTQIYIHRMQQCGIEFGELPLSDYFWKSVSSMHDPLDYVTRLSLTFEQANLDYSREYGKIFANLGDAPTANILDKIYRDEIGHVGFGLRWFRKWKAAGKTDWEVFRDRLTFPLSPARAKGNHFNAQGRRDAGLDDAFIKDLEVFSQSRGRTPSVLWFNPESERFAAQDSASDFSWGTSVLQNDLEFLPAYLARKGDVLILKKSPPAEFLQQRLRWGFNLPELLTPTTTPPPLHAPELDRKVGDLRPWAWSPDSVAFFVNTFDSVTRHKDLDTYWNPSRRQLFSKVWSAHWASENCSSSETADWLAPAETYGTEVSSIAQLESTRLRLRELGYTSLALKAPFGTAANAMRKLVDPEPISQETQTWIDTTLAQQGSLLIEPWLDRVFDFSVQFEKRADHLKLIAFTRLENNHRGQFKGILTNAFTHGLSRETLRFAMQPEMGRPRVYSFYEKTLLPPLETALEAAQFHGPLGIDAFVYRTPQGNLRLKPIVEINPRFTMGRIAHELSTHIAPRSSAYFQIITRSQAKKAKLGSFSQYANTLAETCPVLLQQETNTRILSGSFPLNDPESASQFLALFHVRQNPDELPLG